MSNEWYSPDHIVEKARNTLGQIDLDPSSCEFANQVVKATKIYTIETNGLDKPWKGNIWFNPPYDAPTLKLFLKKADEEIESGNVKNIIMLMNATVFENTLIYALSYSRLCCFPKRRLKFYNAEGKSNTNRFGNVILAYGDTYMIKRFYANFSDVGPIYKQIGKYK